MAETKTLRYLIEIDVTKAAAGTRRLQRVRREVQAMDGTMKKTSTSSVGLAANMGKLVSRALMVIPVWLVLRGAFMGVLNAIKSVIQIYIDLDKGMRKVMAVAQETGRSQASIYAELEMKALSYYTTSTRSIKDITEAMYQLGTAGRSVEEISKGFSHILDLATGTFGDVRTAGRTVAGILNVFEKELKEVGDTEQQVQYITDLLSDAWRNNQVELNELYIAMGYLAAAGVGLGITLKELVATSAVMSDAMLRGGKGARALARAYLQMAKEQKKLREIGVLFDPRQPLDFYNVMSQLHDIYEENAKSMDLIGSLTDIFGIRGSRSIMAILTQWEKWNEEIGRSPDKIDQTALKLKRLAEMSWGGLFTKFWRQAIRPPTDIGAGTSLKEPLARFLMGEEDVEAQKMAIVDLWKSASKEISLTTKEAADLAYYLTIIGSPNLAKKIRETFGATSRFGDYRAGRTVAKGLLETPKQKLVRRVAEEGLTPEQIKTELKSTRFQKERTSEELKFLASQKMELEQLKNIVIIGELQFMNLRKSEIAHQKIVQWVTNYNKSIRETIVNTEEQNKYILDTNDALNGNVEALAKSKLGHEDLVALMKLYYQSVLEVKGELYEWSNIIQGAVKDSLSGLLSGEYGFEEFGQRLGNLISKGIGDQLSKMFTEEFMKAGTKIGMLTGAIGGAYSGYQRGGVGGGILGGLGGMMMMSGNASISMLGAGLTFLSMLFGKKKTETKVEERQQSFQVTSRIDVTNRQLQLVNRNLIALRATFETYILPTSAYFARGGTLEDQFSLHARRGG